jgi:lipopolysaccharide/colanic/teichoic acid biosynthesis glycosyltransferase
MLPSGNLGVSKRAVVSPPQAGSRVTRDARRSAGHASLHIVEMDHKAKDEVFAYSKIHVPQRDPLSAYVIFKRFVDIVGAVAGIVIFSPLIVAIVICSFSSGGSPIFRHRRVGRNGKSFGCLKFRTMVRNADEVLRNLLDSDRQAKEEWLRDHKLKDDPRVTLFGRFLRKTSLDEVPQFWNVLRGEMSLVGPRPVVPDELRRYGTKIPTYLSARPGITGLWQVSGRNDMDYRKRVALDVCYVRSKSVVLDTYILLKTLPVMFAKNGAY